MSEQTTSLNRGTTGATTRRAQPFNLHIRRSRYDRHDYEAAVAIENAHFPEHPQDAESWRHSDSNREPHYLWRRYIGEINGKVVATAEFGHTFWSYKPGKFFIFVAVAKDQQKRGIGSAFYNFLLDEAHGQKAALLVTQAREDHRQTFRFLEKRGFKSVLRMPTSSLKVATFKAHAFEQKVREVMASGITIKSLARLRNEDPDWLRKTYELEWECLQDVPSTDPITKRSLEQFEEGTMAHPRLLPDGWFIACDGDRYVGMSALFSTPSNPELFDTGLTGVVRSHRRRGIATALKVRAIEYARESGAKEITTDNEENNPMFQLNLMLGFEPRPAFHELRKSLLPAV